MICEIIYYYYTKRTIIFTKDLAQIKHNVLLESDVDQVNYVSKIHLKIMVRFLFFEKPEKDYLYTIFLHKSFKLTWKYFFLFYAC